MKFIWVSFKNSLKIKFSVEKKGDLAVTPLLRMCKELTTCKLKYRRIRFCTWLIC